MIQSLEGWHVDYPSAVVQMITFLYQNSPNFFAIAHSEEFVLAMFSALIQVRFRSRGFDMQTNIVISLGHQRLGREV